MRRSFSSKITGKGIAILIAMVVVLLLIVLLMRKETKRTIYKKEKQIEKEILETEHRETIEKHLRTGTDFDILMEKKLDLSKPL